jgi:hypothetical protein
MEENMKCPYCAYKGIDREMKPKSSRKDLYFCRGGLFSKKHSLLAYWPSIKAFSTPDKEIKKYFVSKKYHAIKNIPDNPLTWDLLPPK